MHYLNCVSSFSVRIISDISIIKLSLWRHKWVLVCGVFQWCPFVVVQVYVSVYNSYLVSGNGDTLMC